MTSSCTSLLLCGGLVASLVAATHAQQPTFRAGVDLVAVDVQVVDDKGAPVAGLGADRFEVTISGRKRTVVSAEFVRADVARATPVSTAPSEASSPAPSIADPAPAAPRMFVLAVDTSSFDVGVSRGMTTAAKSFVERLQRTDLVGLSAYPYGPSVNPTTDHAAILAALDRVVASRDRPAVPLTPGEILDGTGGLYARKRCGNDASCMRMIEIEIKEMVAQYESEASRSLGALRSILEGMSKVPGRKTLVLLSGGLVASESPAGRPSVGDLGVVLGQEAARANTAIYTLFVDWQYLKQFDTSTAGVPSAFGSRDSRVLSGWLSKFTDSAGGKLFTVIAGAGESAFDRILTETSGYYVLGVEPEAADRDGRPRELKVKLVSAPRGLAVRARSWVAIPNGATN